MKSSNAIWGIRSATFWMVLLPALGIIFVGARFMLDPQAGAAGFGIPFTDIADQAYGKIKGIRDIFSGLVLLPLLFMRMKKAVAWVFAAATMVPATDCLIVLLTNGSSDITHLLIHGLTALYMAITSIFLFRGKTANV